MFSAEVLGDHHIDLLQLICFDGAHPLQKSKSVEKRCRTSAELGNKGLSKRMGLRLAENGIDQERLASW